MSDIDIPTALLPGRTMPQIYGFPDGHTVKMLIYLLEMALVDELARTNPNASNVADLVEQVGQKLRVHDDDVRVALTRLHASGVFEDVSSGSAMVRLANLPPVHEDQSYRVTALVHLIPPHLRNIAANTNLTIHEHFETWLRYSVADVEAALEVLVRHNVVVIEGETVKLAARTDRPETPQM